MPSLNIFIDGTWRLVQCAAAGSMSNSTEHPDRRFPLDFSKLNSALLNHAKANGGICNQIGDCYLSTSIFTLPTDFDEWPERFDTITSDQIERVKRAVFAREAFVAKSVEANYKTDAVYRPPIREHIIRRLSEKRYQEKQVDTSVVALLVRAAITKPNDYHVLITGDSDILPAIRVAYPEFTENVFLSTTHPDEMNPNHRQTAFSLIDFDFKIPPFFMQNKENAVQIIEGTHSYRCEECGYVFTTTNPIPKTSRARCTKHRPAPRRA